MTANSIQDVKAADNALKEAQISLSVAVKTAYPVGTVLLVLVGSRKVKVRVNRHNSAYWSSPGYLFGLNVASGKERHFHHSAIFEVVTDD